MDLPTELFDEMFVSLEKSVAMYELLISHAKGQTDLTEDQLANVVTGISLETRAVIRRASTIPRAAEAQVAAGYAL